MIGDNNQYFYIDSFEFEIDNFEFDTSGFDIDNFQFDIDNYYIDFGFWNIIDLDHMNFWYCILFDIDNLIDYQNNYNYYNLNNYMVQYFD